MKTTPMGAVAPLLHDPQARLPTQTAPPAASSAAGPAAAGAAGTAGKDSSTTSADSGGRPPGWAAVEKLESLREEGRKGIRNTRAILAQQRIDLSRMRLEAMLLEAQMAAATGDTQRARALARGVRMEVDGIRKALTLAGADGSGAAAAQATAAKASAEARSLDDSGGARGTAPQAAPAAMAPWQQPGSAAPVAATGSDAGKVAEETPSDADLRRSAADALRVGDMVLDILSRTRGGSRLAGGLGDADMALRRARQAAAAPGGAGGPGDGLPPPSVTLVI